MRAAVLTGWRKDLDIADVPAPQVPRDGVVLRLLACGVCRSDWHAWTGADPDVTLPHIPGHEFCGEIVEVGADVRRWTPGARVIAPFILACGTCPACQSGHQTTCADQRVPGFTGPGAFAEFVAVEFADANLVTLPDAISPVLGAALGCRATTAWQALTGRAQVQPGETVAVFGTGGIGLATLILANALGARVIAVDVVEDKLTHARQLGAVATVNAAQTDPVQAVRDLTGGGADVAIEALGMTETTANAMKSLAKRGRMVMVGMPAGAHVNMTLPMDALYSGQLTLMGTRGMAAHRYPSLLRLIEDGRADLAPMIGREIALGDVTTELHAFDRPAPPGVAVITDFSR